MYKDVHLLLHIIIQVHIYVLVLTLARVHILIHIFVHIHVLVQVKVQKFFTNTVTSGGEKFNFIASSTYVMYIFIIHFT
jgi:hypothetical protein